MTATPRRLAQSSLDISSLVWAFVVLPSLETGMQIRFAIESNIRRRKSAGQLFAAAHS
jgi:hypothetical protein